MMDISGNDVINLSRTSNTKRSFVDQLSNGSEHRSIQQSLNLSQLGSDHDSDILMVSTYSTSNLIPVPLWKRFPHKSHPSIRFQLAFIQLNLLNKTWSSTIILIMSATWALNYSVQSLIRFYDNKCNYIYPYL